jgi:hypothetical protein
MSCGTAAGGDEEGAVQSADSTWLETAKNDEVVVTGMRQLR